MKSCRPPIAEMQSLLRHVLARLPDAPPGPKGSSLFLVPKFYPDGTRSEAHCERIEAKMGLHGSPTCVMRFDAATGWMASASGRGKSAAEADLIAELPAMRVGIVEQACAPVLVES